MDRYERHRSQERPWWHRVVVWGLGCVLLAVGLIFAVIPGPGIPFLFVGGGLIASESRPVARLLDWMELQIRGVVRWLKRLWRAAPTIGKAGMVAVAVLASGAGAGAGYWWFVVRP